TAADGLREQLTAQLHAVGAELSETRAVLAQQVATADALREKVAAFEAGVDPTSSDQARLYRRRESLVLVPLLLALHPPDDAVVVVDGGAREVDRDARWRPFPPGRLRFYGFEADPAEAERLSRSGGHDAAQTTFFPAGLWGTTGTCNFEHNHAEG